MDDPSVTSHSVGVDGTVEICDLEPTSHLVVLELGDGVTAQQQVDLRPGPGQVVPFDLGEGSIHGHVTGLDRAPAAGSCVLASLTGRSTLAYITLAGADGGYEICWIPESEVTVDAYFGGWTFAEIDDSKAVRLSPAARERVDLGVGADWVRLSGALLTSTQSVIASNPSYPARLRLRMRPDGRLQVRQLGDDGRYDVLLAPGRYDVEVVLPGRSQVVPLGVDLEIGTVDVERDLEVPGARIVGSIRGWSSSGTQGERSRQVTMFEESSPFETRVRAPIDESGRFVVDGIAPGTWCLRHGSQREAEQSTIVVSASSSLVEVTLEPL